MTYVLTQPQALATAAADVAGIGSAINDAKTAAIGPTTGVLAAAGDEVSSAVAALFNTYAQDYQAILKQVGVFQSEFAQTLATAGNAYAQVEAAASRALGALTAPAPGVAGGTTTANTPVDPDVLLIMTGSGTPTPPQNYINAVYTHYVAPNFPVTGPLIGLSTPEGAYPFTGVKDLTFDISLGRGAVILNNAIQAQVAAGNTVVVSGYSQSSMLASLVMPQLVAEHVPSTDVSFVLMGNPSNPNGGLFSRFPTLSLPALGVTAGHSFGVTTPSNDYPTVIYTQEYDGFADFPEYPIDPLSDLNALMGIVFVHGQYPYLNPAALPPGYSITTLPQSGAPSMTTYYMINVPNLPLLDPLRVIPVIGNPLADALQGPLTPLVNWGYGNPAYGYSTSPANLATPFGFLPGLSATTALVPAMVSGTQQGLGAAAAALHAGGTVSVPALSLSGMSHALAGHQSVASALALPTAVSTASTIDNFILSLETANTNLVGGFANALSAAYATLLPTADIATSLAISLPSYDVNLFLDGMIQAVNGQPLVGLVNAIGRPIAANVGITTLAGGFELITLVNALQTILTGAPNPGLGNTFSALG